jgi:immunoglobulin-binding protein 1
MSNESSLSEQFDAVQRDLLAVSEREERLGSNDSQVQLELDRLFALCDALATRLRREAVFSANEAMDDVNTSDLRLVLTHFYAGSITLRRAKPARDERIRALKTGRVYLSLFVNQCRLWQLLSDRDVDALERYRPNSNSKGDDDAPAALSPGAMAQAKREYKIERFKREKDTRLALKAMLDKRAARGASTVGDDNGGFDDDSEWRSFETLQIKSAILESFALLESAVDELNMLEEIERRMQAAGGEDRLRAELQRERTDAARNTPPPQPPVTIMPGDLRPPGELGQAPAPGRPMRSAVEARLDTRQQLARDVFKQPHIVATYTPEEAAEMDMAAGRFLSGGGNDPSADKDDKDEDADQDDDAKLRKARDWDDFKDDNPRGAGNRSRKG